MLEKLGRIVSTINFSAIVLLILAYPYAFKDIVGTSRYGFMSFTIMTACLSVVYAFGYKPQNKFWKVIINPLFTTPLLVCFLYGMFR